MAVRNLDVPRLLSDRDEKSGWIEHGYWIIYKDNGSTFSISDIDFRYEYQPLNQEALSELNL